MPDEPARPWTLIGFTERFAEWVDRETIDERVQQVVAAWIGARALNPYQGVRLEDGFPDLWWGHIPGTFHKGGEAVAVCVYFIDAGGRTVRCDTFASLSWPV
jgi:hypothetical protein